MATSSSSPMAPEEEESWCSLYLCSRVIGIMVVVLCKSRVALGDLLYLFQA